MTTVAEAIVKVALNMSLVSGQGMSPYSDDQIAQYLSNAHDMLTAKYVWPELNASIIKTLDGTTGKVTVAFNAAEGITDYKQIKHIYSENVQRELPVLSGVINPLMQSSVIGYRILSIAEDPNKQYLFAIQPVTWAGRIAITANLKADFSNPDTVIPIDDLLHIWIATWMWAEDDATNPAQAEKYLKLWEDRVKDIRSNVNTGPYALNPFNGPLDTWWMLDV